MLSQAASAATQHLIALRRRRIAVIGANGVAGAATTRLAGHLAALHAAGIAGDDALIADPGLSWDRTAGSQATQKLLDAGIGVDALFGFNDALALGAMHVLLRNGSRIPKDVAVIGFDNVEETRFSTPPLTSIDPGRARIAITAVGLLTKKIEGTGAAESSEIYADFTLEVRESTIG